MTDEKVRLGYKELFRALVSERMLTKKYLPAQYYLAAMAALLAFVPNSGAHQVRQKLFKWYFGSYLTKRFHGGDPLLVNDVVNLAGWLKNETDEEPAFLRKMVISESTATSPSAARLAISILMKSGAKDFATSEIITDHVFTDSNFDVHHVFPKKWCKDNGIGRELYDQIYNMAPMSQDTNQRIIRDLPPSIYLMEIQEGHGISEKEMDDLLLSQSIDPIYLRTDDFHGFIRSRRHSILGTLRLRVPGTLVEDVGPPADENIVLPSYRTVMEAVLAEITSSHVPMSVDDLSLRVVESHIGNRHADTIEAMMARVKWSANYLVRKKAIRRIKGAFAR